MAWKKAETRKIVVDIETVADEPTKDELTAKKALHPGVSKDALIELCKSDYCFSMHRKRMISVAFGEIEMGGVERIEGLCVDDQRALAQFMKGYLDDSGMYSLIGYNHRSFDMPEMAKTLYRAGLTLRNKPGKWDVIDLCYYPLRGVKLKDAAPGFGIETMGLNGGAVADMFKKEEFDKILAYNKDDVRITGELYVALSTLFTFE